MADTRPPTDAGKLKYALVTLLGEDAGTYADNPVHRSLAYAGIDGFNNDFVGITEADIGTLTVPGDQPSDPHVALPMGKRRKLIILLGFYQATSREAKGAVNINTCTRVQFDTYRIGDYDHSKPIIPWNTPDSLPSSFNDELSNWKK